MSIKSVRVCVTSVRVSVSVKAIRLRFRVTVKTIRVLGLGLVLRPLDLELGFVLGCLLTGNFCLNTAM